MHHQLSKLWALPLLLLSISANAVAQEARSGSEVTFEKLRLTDKFYAEGAGIGDMNQDGQGDAIYGPYWFEGPEFKTRHGIYTAEEFDPHKYSNNFITFVADVNGDKWPDVLVNAWPGKDVSWFENPKQADTVWQRHLAHPTVDNESPGFADMDGDGRKDIVFHTEGVLGYAGPTDSTGTARWVFKGCSEKNSGWQRYTHGLGSGDVNGDGRPDLLMAGGWWEQPANGTDQPWKQHAYPFGSGGAQMHTYDVDGDGDNDVITSLVAHGYGLSWFEHVKQDGEITFVQHNILSPNGEEKVADVQFSQLHSVELADVNNDGLKDIITGKRFWAHGPKGDADPAGPAVVYWFELQRSADGVQYIPHQIDDDSGVGTQFAVGDLNGDGRIDIVTGNKKGGHVFIQR